MRTSGKGPICYYPLPTKGSHVRGVDPYDLSMSMKNSLPVSKRTRGGSHSLTVDPWTMILLPVLRETTRAIGPLLSGELSRSIVCCDDFRDSITDLPHRCNCDQRWHKSSIHMLSGKNEVDTITQKKSNGTLLIQLQHSPYSFFLNPLLSGCKLFWDFISSFLNLN